MFDTRRRRLAWLFALVLLMELALLCCACAQLSAHLCPGHGTCAICRQLSAAPLRFALLPIALASAMAALSGGIKLRATVRRAPLPTPVIRKVRLND